MKKLRIKKIAQNHGIGVAVIAIVGLSGIWLISQSKAVTTNPYGYVDYCKLEGTTTAIYGWASDPNATTTAQPNVTITVSGTGVTTPNVTVATNRASYRDTPINNWINANRAGDPKPGTYGFRAAWTGLYKGTRYTITGTAVNVGAGANTALTVNKTQYADGDTTRPYFAGGIIPDPCLATKPAPPPPPPAPAPAPSPPPPAPAPKPVPKPIPRPVPPPTPPAPSSDANGGAIAGTLAATINIPAGNAKKVRINYGTEPALLTQATNDQEITGADAQISLTGLKPATTYSYQIIRTNSTGQTATSPVASFSTAGFAVALHFVNNKSMPVAGVSASIKSTDKQAKSNSDGLVRFDGMGSGDYTVVYKWNNKTNELPIVADGASLSPDQTNATTQAVLDYDINVEQVSVTAPAKPEDNSNRNLIAWIVLSALAIALVIGLIARQRHKNKPSPYEEIVEESYHFNTSSGVEEDEAPSDENTDQPPAPDTPPPPPVFPPLDGSDGQPQPPAPAPPQTPLPRGVHQLPGDSPEHMGMSLKQMVLRSMAETERQRTSQQQPHLPTPGQDSQPHAPRDSRDPNDPSHHYPWK